MPPRVGNIPIRIRSDLGIPQSTEAHLPSEYRDPSTGEIVTQHQPSLGTIVAGGGSFTEAEFFVKRDQLHPGEPDLTMTIHYIVGGTGFEIVTGDIPVNLTC